MKFWPVLLGIAGIIAWVAGRPVQDKSSILVSGNLQGYLAPCGCSFPMSGGIVRRGSIAAPLKSSGVAIDNGRWIVGSGAQDRMKAQAAADALITSEVAAINFTPDLAKLGKGDVLSIGTLAAGRLVNAQLATNEFQINPNVSIGSFLITGVTTNPNPFVAIGLVAKPWKDAVTEFVIQASESASTPILLLDGNLNEAKAIATANPSLALVVYQSNGNPPEQPIKQGTTILVTPGDRGRNLVRLGTDGTAIGGYESIDLGPQVNDDKATKRIYDLYLTRVDRSSLLEQTPRTDGKPFAGSSACLKCHGKAAVIWKGSAHAHALETLANVGHARDPDCVACHVVGLTFNGGFRSPKITPDLANVGCESCHGAAKAHAQHPSLVKMAKLTAAACAPCHTADNSPGFNYQAYWKKIAH